MLRTWSRRPIFFDGFLVSKRGEVFVTFRPFCAVGGSSSLSLVLANLPGRSAFTLRAAAKKAQLEFT